ncbi:acetyl-CoA carboxylase biotin carboxyl carrier protein subunit [Sabulilitoribacter multivorans]|uniref:Acetyl-CoA carboxylase biotin carboxyl carrier protein subunit n=1 Tax=Flaviramulus multivorans TaxID=1304750 RepID=A0ABS9IJZ5_9FLAO|nr:acetyl-CoA carboxylase biotin carboxyl carrier protein subunit [Flaviramulus multivorans]MCF7560929.1 acetyl-CoA carboxylase biotin carboxyl carrier protein subunit [Flaviramulus multivorans]
MSKVFKATVNNSIEFEFTDSDISNLDALKTSDYSYHILQNNKSYKAEILEANFNNKSYKVKVKNNTYNINIHNDLDVLINEMGFALGASKHINTINAPMPGLILEINTEAGQEVKENDSLLILEAMKMENIITSPRDGKIKTVLVKKGDAVEKNQLLIEFE